MSESTDAVLERLGIDVGFSISDGIAASKLMAKLSRSSAQQKAVTSGLRPRDIHARWTSTFGQVHKLLGVEVPQDTRDAVFCGDTDAAYTLLDQVVDLSRGNPQFSFLFPQSSSSLSASQPREEETISVPPARAVAPAVTASAYSGPTYAEKHVSPLKPLRQMRHTAVSTDRQSVEYPNEGAVVLSQPPEEVMSESSPISFMAPVLVSTDFGSSSTAWTPSRSKSAIPTSSSQLSSSSGSPLVVGKPDRKLNQLSNSGERRRSTSTSYSALSPDFMERQTGRTTVLTVRRQRALENKLSEERSELQRQLDEKAKRERLYRQSMASRAPVQVQRKMPVKKQPMGWGGAPPKLAPIRKPAKQKWDLGPQEPILGPLSPNSGILTLAEPDTPSQSGLVPLHYGYDSENSERVSSSEDDEEDDYESSQDTAPPTPQQQPVPVSVSARSSQKASPANSKAASPQSQSLTARSNASSRQQSASVTPRQSPRSAVSSARSVATGRSVSPGSRPLLVVQEPTEYDTSSEDSYESRLSSPERTASPASSRSDDGSWDGESEDEDAVEHNADAASAHGGADEDPHDGEEIEEQKPTVILASIPEVVTFVQRFVWFRLAFRKALHSHKRNPAATMIQCVFRFATYYRKLRATPPAYEEFPTVPLTSCSRCLPILDMLQISVKANPSLDARHVNNYKKVLCAECASKIWDITEQARLVVLHCDNPEAVADITRVQACLRWILARQVLDHKTSKSPLLLAASISTNTRQLQVIRWMQLVLLFKTWRLRFSRPRPPCITGCSRCGPIIEALNERMAHDINVDRSRYTSLMCSTCNSQISREALQQFTKHKLRFLTTVTKALVLFLRPLHRQPQSKFAFASCPHCAPIVETCAERLVHQRFRMIVRPYEELMCADCDGKAWAATAVETMNAKYGASQVYVATNVILFSQRLLKRVRPESQPSVEGVEAKDQAVLSALEAHVKAHDEDVTPATIERYDALLSEEKRTGVEIVDNTRNMLRAVVFLQCYVRFQQHMRRNRIADRQKAIGVILGCTRCQPIKDSLKDKIERDPHAPMNKLMPYVDSMCNDCKPPAEQALIEFVNRRKSVRLFEMLYRFVRMRRLVPPRKQPTVTRGSCPRCDPLLVMFRKAVLGKSEEERAELSRSYMGAVCKRCAFTVEAITKHGVEESAVTERIVPTSEAYPGQATKPPRKMKGIDPRINLMQVHENAAKVVQAHLRQRHSDLLAKTKDLILFQQHPSEPFRGLVSVQLRFRFKMHLRKIGGAPKWEDNEWGCTRCAPIADAAKNYFAKNPLASIRDRKRYVHVMCPACSEQFRSTIVGEASQL